MYHGLEKNRVRVVDCQAWRRRKGQATISRSGSDGISIVGGCDHPPPTRGDQGGLGAFLRLASIQLCRRTVGVCGVPVASNGPYADTHRQPAREVRRSAFRSFAGVGAGVAALLGGATSDGLRTGLARLHRHLRRRDRALSGPESEAGSVALIFPVF